MTPRPLPPCGRCGAPARFGFTAPHGRAPRGSLYACAAHREAAEAAWRQRYEVAA